MNEAAALLVAVFTIIGSRAFHSEGAVTLAGVGISGLAMVLLLPLFAGSLVYCALTIVAAYSYRRSARPPVLNQPLPISVLKPLCGVEPEFDKNIRSFFEQEYPYFELIFAVHRADDPAVAALQSIQEQFPHVTARLIVTGQPPYPNAKVFSLSRMVAEARYDILVMSDSDVRVTPKMLEVMAAELQDRRVGLLTCPYRAVPPGSYVSALEAIGINTEFFGGVLVARMIEGMKFALGPTIATRKDVLDRIGGLGPLKDYLAEDFVIGKLVAASGYRVLLSSYAIDHHIGSSTFRENWKHRLRWMRSTRRSRPSGYFGQVFTYPVPLSVLICLARPEWWPAVGLALLFRAAAAWAVAGHAIKDPLTRKWWWSIPIQDLLAFATWIAGFVGNTVLWRGRKYYLHPDGRFELVR